MGSWEVGREGESGKGLDEKGNREAGTIKWWRPKVWERKGEVPKPWEEGARRRQWKGSPFVLSNENDSKPLEAVQGVRRDRRKKPFSVCF